MNRPEDRPVPVDTLTELFAAAAGPPEPDELAGEDAVVAAFRAHQFGRDRSDRHRPATGTPLTAGARLARWFTIKGIAVCAGTLAAGGVAVAATTGSLPAPPADRSPAIQPSQRPPVPSGPPTHPATHASPAATRSASTVQLCLVFVHAAPRAREELLDRVPDYQILVTQAGGRSRVEAYCGRVLAASPLPGTTPDLPSWAVPSALPTAYPTGPAIPPLPPLPTGLPGRH